MLWLHSIATALAGLGCALLLAAGRRDRSGDRETAKRWARTAGFLVAGATLVQLAVAPWLPWGTASLAAACGAGVTALLAGLSGKPRQSDVVAALLWIVGLLLRLRA
jgi:hypothetical protein